MDSTLKEKWIAALRSGKYQQGSSCLRPSENTYCCLGVLCDVEDNTKWNERYSAYDYDNSMIVLPDYLGEKAGLSREQETILWKMNDTEGVSFADIANYIEGL